VSSVTWLMRRTDAGQTGADDQHVNVLGRRHHTASFWPAILWRR
jgi:hypothetical protein